MAGGRTTAAFRRERRRTKASVQGVLLLGVLGLLVAAAVTVGIRNFSGKSLPSEPPSVGSPGSGGDQESSGGSKDATGPPKGQHEGETPPPAVVPNARAQRYPDHGTTEVVGSKTFHPSFGIFPKGCKWRPVTEEGKTGWDYVWWDFDSKAWVEEKPAACAPTGHPKPGPSGWNFLRGTPRTEVACSDSHCMYTNLFYNRGRWYALVDGPNPVPTWRFSRNQEIVTIHVADVWDFVDSVKWNVIPGDTLLFDFIYFTHPTAIGHWWEMLGPMYSILKNATFKRPCDQFILLHLQRRHILEWVRAMVAVALGVGVEDELPPVFIQEATDNAHQQITAQLEGLDRDTWYIFENVAITKDLYTGGQRTFLSTKVAREFRGLIYQQYGFPVPISKKRVNIPHAITYQRKRANRRILNEEEFIEMLKEFGDVRVVEYNETSSLYEQLLCMRETVVYISVHTSNLANAPLLQPGSAVFEILQRNWHWNGLDTSFRDQTILMGDIHHYAWRAQLRNETFYLEERDRIKVAHWPPEECGTEECVEAQTKVDVKVDIQAFRALLQDRLPFVWNGTHPYYADIPWPDAKDPPEYMALLEQSS